MNQTEIANLALRKIGQARIVDFNATSNEAELIRDSWTNARQTSLRAAPWNFALKQAQLTASSTTPLFHWRFSYPLPADYMRLVSNNGILAGTKLPCWEVASGAVFSNESKADIVYVRDEENTSLWDSQFCEAIAFQLAAMIAPSLLADGGSAAALMMQAKFSSMMLAMLDNKSETAPKVVNGLQGSAYQAARCAPAPGDWDCRFPGPWGIPAEFDVQFNPFAISPP